MKKKILIIEDDEAILEAMEIMLTEEGYLVKKIDNGLEAMDEVITFRPSLVFLDMLMSGTDGREICETIKKNKLTKDIKVVMISAFPEAGKLVMQSGADHFLAKPFGAQELLDVAAKYC